MNYTKKELQAILSFVRTARVQPNDHALTPVGTVVFSIDTGKEVKWIDQKQLVSKLKQEIKERDNGSQ